MSILGDRVNTGVINSWDKGDGRKYRHVDLWYYVVLPSWFLSLDVDWSLGSQICSAAKRVRPYVC